MENTICITGIKRRQRNRCGRSDTDSGGTDRSGHHIQRPADFTGEFHIRKDHKRKLRYLKGEVTVYLTLVFALIMSLVTALTESASIQMAKNYRRADMNRAMECVFAEYQKELLEQYDLFGLEAGYETGSYSEENIKNRLAYYGADMDNQIKRIELFTDNHGQAFIREVGKYMKHRYGVSWADQYLGNTSLWKHQEEQVGTFGREETLQKETLESLLKDQEAELPTEENPMAHVGVLKSTPILNLVLPKDKQVSEKRIALSDMPEKRQNQTGYGSFEDVENDGNTLSSVLMGEYALEHFGAFTEAAKGGALDYELEYILGGKESDRENLEAVANRLVMLRFVPNYLYLQSSSAKQAEARALAGTLCTLLAVPAITEAAAQGILLAWAYGESVMDVRTLFSGKNVTATKNDANWQLSLAGLMKLGTEEDGGASSDMEGGNGYKEYLRILLFLEGKETMAVRSMGMIEKNMQTLYGQPGFRMDYCVSRMEVETVCRLRRNVQYQFQTYYGYQ